VDGDRARYQGVIAELLDLCGRLQSLKLRRNNERAAPESKRGFFSRLFK
jgi:hypothetical protein